MKEATGDSSVFIEDLLIDFHKLDTQNLKRMALSLTKGFQRLTLKKIV